jgi:hypothetical protein
MYTGRTCGAVWSYERYVDYELRGFVRDTHRVGNLSTSSYIHYIFFINFVLRSMERD